MLSSLYVMAVYFSSEINCDHFAHQKPCLFFTAPTKKCFPPSTNTSNQRKTSLAVVQEKKKKGMFTEPRCVFVCPCLLLTRVYRATPPWHTAEREREQACSSLPPSMQKENTDQGLNNTSHCGKYIGLNFPLGAASSHWVNMSDRQSLSLTHTHEHTHTNRLHLTCLVTKTQDQTNTFTWVFFFFFPIFPPPPFFKQINEELIVCQIW